MTTSVQAPEFTVSPVETTVEAGQPLEVTVRFVASASSYRLAVRHSTGSARGLHPPQAAGRSQRRLP
jgi:hypothetical protein